MNSHIQQRVQRSLRRRRLVEHLFRWAGRVSIAIGVGAVLLLFISIFSRGLAAFQQTYLQLDVEFDPQVLQLQALSEQQLALADFDGVVRKALLREFPEVVHKRDRRELFALASYGAGLQLRQMLEKDNSLLAQRISVSLLVDDAFDTYVKTWNKSAPVMGRLSAQQREWIGTLMGRGKVITLFNRGFITRGDSAEPEQAGILGALMGSLFTMLVTGMLSFPIGVASAIYLEEYAKKNAFTDFLEVNINNLAAVPSVIFGLLGLAIFLNFFNMPRSTPLVGGMVLCLMTLPTVIIASRAAIKSVPPSIREAALGLGASKMQVVLQHVVPFAMPGMLTGAIIGMARALGETAPLLMIGMVAFISDIPSRISDPASVLPVQIFLWSEEPERAFIERTAAAIMVLLVMLITMNAFAVWLRKRLENRS